MKKTECRKGEEQCREDNPIELPHGSEFGSLRIVGKQEMRRQGMHWDHEPNAARVGARASWTAATESSESPLWVVQRCRRWASAS